MFSIFNIYLMSLVSLKEAHKQKVWTLLLFSLQFQVQYIKVNMSHERENYNKMGEGK